MKKLLCIIFLIFTTTHITKSEGIWDPTTTKIPGQIATTALYPEIASDSKGNSIAVWQQNDGSNNQVYYSYWNGTIWTDATTIPGQPATNANIPQIALDSDGNAIAVWRQYNGSDYQAYYAYWNGATWTDATTIPGQPAEHANSIRIAFDSNGNAIAVWGQYDGSNVQIYYAYWDGTTWTDATTIPGQLASLASAPEIAFDSNKNAIAVWEHEDGGNEQIYYALWNGATWTNAATIAEQASDDATFPQIAVDPNGNAITVWYERDDSGIFQIYYSYWNGTTWTDASIIPGKPAINGFSPQIAFDSNGNAITVWKQNGIGYSQIYYAYWDGTTWSITATAIPGQPESFASNPKIAFDSNGNAIAVWQQYDGSNYLVEYAYRDGTIWTDASTIPNQPAESASNPKATFDPTGNAITIWQQNDGSNTQIYYARLVKPFINYCRQESHYFPSQTDLINVLNWNFSTPNIAQYNIYTKPYGSSEDYQFIGSVPDPTSYFFHHNRYPGQHLTYVITAVDINGNESNYSNPICVP